jgi:hypothetical protein
MIGLPLGLLYSNAGEWVIHKYVLHRLGQKKTSLWSFHWHEHHRVVRRNDGEDANYRAPLFRRLDPKTKEAVGLLALAALHAPLLPVAPWFTLGVWYGAARYYYAHRRAHLDPAWGRAHLPWHMDHHLGPDQDKNWCVTRPWFDWIMGTREPYVGTEREAQDLAKKAATRMRIVRAETDANADATAVATG